MQKQMLEYRIKDSIRGSKAKNADVVLRMVDQSKVSIDGENLLGLSEQLEALKKSDAYLFEDAPGANGGVDPHQNPSGSGAANNNWSVNQAIRAAAGRN